MSTLDSGMNQLESKVGGFTVGGKVHSLSAWFVLALRLMMGYAFAYSGFIEDHWRIRCRRLPVERRGDERQPARGPVRMDGVDTVVRRVRERRRPVR